MQASDFSAPLTEAAQILSLYHFGSASICALHARCRHILVLMHLIIIIIMAVILIALMQASDPSR